MTIDLLFMFYKLLSLQISTPLSVAGVTANAVARRTPKGTPTGIRLSLPHQSRADGSSWRTDLLRALFPLCWGKDFPKVELWVLHNPSLPQPR